MGHFNRSRCHYSRESETDRRLLYFGIVAVVLVVFGVLAYVTGIFEPNVSRSSLSASRVFHDFGDIDIFGGKVSTTYDLANTGPEPVEINFVKTNCMCTEAVIDGYTFGMHGPFNASIEFQPGETKELKAVFDPMAHGPNATGPITREILLRTNSEKTKELKLRFIGNVVKK